MPPSYFYHLAFELYPHPPKSHAAVADVEPLFVPPPGTDIFQSHLPVHRISSWASPPRWRKNVRRSKTAYSVDLTTNRPAVAQRPSYSERRNSHLDSTSSNAPPASEALQLLAAKKPAASAAAATATKDWRFDRVSVQSIDMEEARAADKDGARGKSVGNNTARAAGSGLATKGRFIPADPKNTEVGWGVVHLYRDAQETPGLYDDTASSAGSDAGGVGGDGEKQTFNEEDCTTLCILAVPSYMTPSDFLGYVGEQTREDVSHFRLIRTGRANKYMVLMKFRAAQKARQWRKEWNGKLFNSMEVRSTAPSLDLVPFRLTISLQPENCHVVFVKSIEFQTSGGDSDPSSFPNMNNDPFTPSARPTPSAPLPAGASSAADSGSLASLSTKPLPPPTSSLVELPTCPVCLERMDETTGLLTILCQHVFHCACLEKWRGSGCPVCRYTQNDSLIARGYASDGEGPENECSVCGTSSNLWICLICGNIGCGRYDSAHAFQHYEATSHSYAMDIATQHVWDYAGDGYVHRLIQNKADGKLVDLPAAHHANSHNHHHHHPNNSMTGMGADTVPREKLDNMGMEYAFLLTSQLDSQRLYFEEQVERAVDKAAKASAAAEEAAASASAVSHQLRELQAQNRDARASVASLERDVQRLTTRAARSDELARSMTKQFQEEKSVSGALMQRIKHLDARVEEVEGRNRALEAEKRELEEQNRDLSFFISGQEKLREMESAQGGLLDEDEVREGRVEVGAAPSEEKEKGKRKKGKGRK
ncbi:ring and ubp finger domain-containing protein [Diplodia corticola]|uniref:Ring and ubp finger domain-containing protein n=1 Tax=Diplodia corticola TaxID=236234 RepID=A0A1J9RGJ4_9PEZI|nr:ring and ubp finger domain-containing protein [Diplodia corticola]OJD40662.1 ring and ubp finger domain-containing protein [Diplodia corticola]